MTRRLQTMAKGNGAVARPLALPAALAQSCPALRGLVDTADGDAPAQEAATSADQRRSKGQGLVPPCRPPPPALSASTAPSLSHRPGHGAGAGVFAGIWPFGQRVGGQQGAPVEQRLCRGSVGQPLPEASAVATITDDPEDGCGRSWCPVKAPGCAARRPGWRRSQPGARGSGCWLKASSSPPGSAADHSG